MHRGVLGRRDSCGACRPGRPARPDRVAGWAGGGHGGLVTMLAGLCLATAVVAQNPRLNLLKNSGFEQMADGKLLEWSLPDAMSTVTTERVHAGKQAVRIVDAEDRKGSNLMGPVLTIVPQREYFLRGWAYLQEGSVRNPVGFYLWSLDDKGKEIKGPDGKQSLVSPRLTEGRWVSFFQPMTVFGGAAKVRVVVHSFDAAKATVFVDDVELLECFPGIFGDTLAWRGGSPDHLVTHGSDYSVRWCCGDADQLVRDYKPPLDWSGYGGLSFWLHANEAMGNAVMLTLASEDPATEGADYWSLQIPVEWKGWKQFIIPFKDLKVSRKPVSFACIERITIAATGWNMTFNPNLVLHLTDLKPIKVVQ